MKSSNPTQRESIYENATERDFALSSRSMTIVGTANKLFLLSIIMLIGAALTFYQFHSQHTDFVSMLMTGGVIAGFIIALVLTFTPKLTPVLGPVYAFSQGLVISGVSCYMESMYKGIVMQAISLTMLTVLVMSLLFSAKIIKATEKFKSVVTAAGLTIFIFYLISFVLMAFFHIDIPYFTVNSPLNIAINAGIAIIAALYLILDFDFIQKGVEKEVPAVYEWYGAFSLLVTIVWLYIEILRLLSRLRNK